MPNFDGLTARDVADIGLQRTAHLFRFPGPIGSPSYRAWAHGIEGPLLLESRIRRKRILDGAWSDAEHEWKTIQAFLPSGGSICDIGCGHAFIDLVAANSVPDLKITLIDIERTEEKHHDYNSRGAGYSSLEQAKNFLCLNGVASNRIAVCNPNRHPLPRGSFDAIISLLSAGFHYPISEYSDFALRSLKSGGALIFDLRDGTDQQASLSKFSDVRELCKQSRSTRLVAIK